MHAADKPCRALGLGMYAVRICMHIDSVIIMHTFSFHFDIVYSWARVEESITNKQGLNNIIIRHWGKPGTKINHERKAANTNHFVVNIIIVVVHRRSSLQQSIERETVDLSKTPFTVWRAEENIYTLSTSETKPSFPSIAFVRDVFALRLLFVLGSYATTAHLVGAISDLSASATFMNWLQMKMNVAENFVNLLR